MMTDPIVDAVCAKLQSRSAVGLKKYGTTLADNAATVKEKLVHIQEELMDAANYVEWLLQDYFSYGVSPAMVSVKMMEKDMPTPMTIEMEAEDIRAALDQINLYIGYTAGHVDDEKYRATWKAFIKVHSALLTKTTKNVTCENLSNADGRQDKWSAFYKYVESETDDGEMLIDGWVAAEDVETIRSALQSPRVPVIEGLDEAIAVINKFIRARDAEIDFLPEKSTKNTSEWISHFMHNVNYSLSFNDWMNLDKVRAYAELSKTQEPSPAPPQKGV